MADIKDYKDRFNSPISGTFTPPKKAKSKAKTVKKAGKKK